MDTSDRDRFELFERRRYLYVEAASFSVPFRADVVPIPQMGTPSSQGTHSLLTSQVYSRSEYTALNFIQTTVTS